MQPYFENCSKDIFVSYKNTTYDFPVHFHNSIEIAFCLSGIQNIRVGEKIYTLKKGDAVAIFPNAIHEYIKYDPPCDEPTEVAAIICNTRLLTEAMPDIVTKYPTNPFVGASLISTDTECAFRKMINGDNYIENIGWTYVILSDLLKHLELKPIEQNLELPSKIVAYINTHFREELNINYIAREFGYHPSYIAHVFCDRLKIPFKTYLGAVRSEYAASQIRTTEKSLTEIAYESGYNSLNTFCRCFKKHFMQTPMQYKKAYYTKV